MASPRINPNPLKPEQIKCSRDASGQQYRSMHDARRTAPDGTVWRVSKVENGIAHLWVFNAWGRLYEETAPIAMLFELDK